MVELVKRFYTTLALLDLSQIMVQILFLLVMRENLLGQMPKKYFKRLRCRENKAMQFILLKIQSTIHEEKEIERQTNITIREIQWWTRSIR